MASPPNPSPTFTILFLLLLFFSIEAKKPDWDFNFPKEKKTHLHFYLHEIIGATTIRVVEGPSKQAFLNFGDMVVIDDPLTEGLKLTSKLVGRAQGFYTQASHEAPALLMAMNFVFLGGKYNGSTLAVLTRNPFTEKVREYPVVGGTGKFRLARGYIITKTNMVNLTTGDATHEYNVYVMHY